ncbi:MAG: hypothetical protein ACLURP_17570 [Ruminococcus sp.]
MPPETDEFIRIIYKLAHDRNIEPMLETGDDDFSMAIPGLSRFRVNTYRQRGSLAAVIRIIAFNLPDPQDLHIPPAVMEAADLTKGMVLITGSCRKRKIHHHGLYHRQDQSQPRRTYHHAGRPFGIPAQT